MDEIIKGPEILIPKRNVILDATTLTGVMTCGRFHNLRQDLQLAPISGKSNSLECGSIVHKYLEIFYKCRIRGMDRPTAHQFGMTAAQLYIQSCRHCLDFEPIHAYEGDHTCDDNCILKPKCGHPPNEYPGLMNTPSDNSTKPSRIGWKWVLETCEQYYAHYQNDYWIPLEVETVKRKIIYQDDNIRILWKGKLDLVVDTNQGIYPCDHKTMKQNRDVVSLNNQFKGQCFLMDVQNVIINKVGFQTSLEPKDKFIRVMVPYSNDALFEWYSEIVPYWTYQLLSYQESEYYPPNYTQCEGKFGPCIFQDVCKADRNMRGEEIRQNFVVAPKWDIDNVED